MRQSILFFVCILCFQFSFAQLADDFSDGNFNSNPTWAGDSTAFKINTQNQLQLNSSIASSSGITTALSVIGIDTIEWDFYIEQSFAPSSQNYSRFYLIEDQSSLSSSLNGYYLQFGESGSNDAISLYKQSGTNSVLIGKGVSGKIASAFGVTIKVIYYPSGLFEIYTDYTGGNNCQFEFSATDNFNLYQGYLGLRCTYTISNATSFYLDNIYVGPLIKDTTPPAVVDAAFINDSIFKIDFSESTSGFTLNNNLQLISATNSVDSIFVNSDSTKFEFKLHQHVNSGEVIQVKLFNVADLFFNLSNTITINLTFVKCEYAHRGDLVINEIMCNASGANNLPNAEYIELYNNSNNFIITNNLLITDFSATGILGNDTIFPHEYKVYTSSAGKSLLQSYGINAISITNFPTLNNDGDQIQLKDSSQIIDEVNYNTSFYNDDFKNQGGWSIEKIQPDYLCANTKNWRASCDVRGGSPGLLNCNNGLLIDNEHPEIRSIYVVDSNHLSIVFTEEINAADFNLNDFVIDNLIIPYAIIIEKTFTNQLILKLNISFLANEIHTLKITHPIFDCNGNLLQGDFKYNFGVGVSPVKGDLIFNEVLFNPSINCGDFIEVYNASDKIISLKNVCCSRRNSLTNQIEYNGKITSNDLTIMPHAYCALINEEFDLKQCYPKIKKQFTINYSLPPMNDDEGKLVLLDANSIILDELYYSEKQHSQLLLDVEGISLERVSFSAATSNSDNWKSASCLSGCSTPTEKNSQAIDALLESKFISINPSVISPDADGFDDNIQIEISNESASMWGSLQIANYNGTVVRNLIITDLIGTNEKMIWDGTDNKKQIVSSGIYILIAQLVSENGVVKNIRLPIIVAEGKR
jgi:hypothetical protein